MGTVPPTRDGGIVNDPRPEVSSAIVRHWTRLYTAGARSELRESRRAQIESDLWEHRTDARARGLTRLGLALEVTGRMARGIPSDIAWRVGTGGLEMRSTFVIERSTGLVMLLVALLLVGAMSGPGISGSEPYFSEDFPGFANDRDAVMRAAILRLIVGVATIPTAILLYLTFRPYSRIIAGLGALGLVGAGVLFVFGGIVTLQLHDLAERWLEGGAVVGDASWREARDKSSVLERTGLFAFMALGLSFAGFGVVIARTAALPRFVAWLSIASGAVLLVSLPLWSFGDWAWYPFMVGTLSMFASFFLAAGWLTLRGTRARPAVVPQVRQEEKTP